MRNFSIRPTLKSSNLISGLNFLFKNTPEGFDILSDNSDPERLIMQLEKARDSNIKLYFALFVKDPIFKVYTELPFDSIDRIFYFSNKDLGDNRHGNLAKNEFVSSDDLLEITNKELVDADIASGIPSGEKGNLLGIIELGLNQDIVDGLILKLIDNELDTFNYNLSFNSRSVVWKYLIVPTYTKKLKDLTIISVDNSEDIKFLPPSITKRDDKELLVFESDRPLKYKEFYNYGFQLKRGEVGNGGKIVIKKLQYPPIDRIKPIPDKPNEYFSEIYVYI